MNFSNILSSSRFVLAAVFAYCICAGTTFGAFAVAVISAITDVLDGWAARRYHQVTELGKILDPLADKAFFAAAAISMLACDLLPLWFVAAVIGRDLLILIGSLFTIGKKKIILQSNYIGKATVVVMWSTFLLALFSSPLAEYGYYTTSAMLATSLVVYSRAMLAAK